jgi:hypothetical protein
MSNGDTPREKAEQDEAAAERMRQLQHSDESLAHAFDSTALTLATLGYDEAAENVQDAADSARHAGVAAKYSADAYEGAAKSWTELEHDLAEQAKLTGEMYGAQATAAGAHQAITGAHGLTEEQQTQLELVAAREDASTHVYQERAAAMGKEAFDDTQHAQVLEESARLGDPESGMAPQ